MWWTAALAAYQQVSKDDKGGGGAGAPAGPATSSSSAAGLSFDNSNWTVATGQGSASGAKIGGENMNVLYIGAALVGLLALVIAVRR